MSPSRPSQSTGPDATPAWRMGRLVGAGLLVLVLTSLTAAEDPPEVLPPVSAQDRILLADVEADPTGEGVRLLRNARTAALRGEIEAAARLYWTIARTHGAVLLPTQAAGTEASAGHAILGGLHWPGREVAQLGVLELVRMDPDLASRVLEPWVAAAQVFLPAAESGDFDALARLAADSAVLPAGRAALRALADRDYTVGRFVDAARGYERWLRFAPDESAAERARVGFQLALSLGHLEDAGALVALPRLLQPELDVEVPMPGGTRTLRALLTPPAPRLPGAADPAGAPTPLGPPPALALGWRHEFDLSRTIHETWSAGERPTGETRAGVLLQDGELYVHEGRIVRRFDLATGTERWQFPRVLLAAMDEAARRYRIHDLPVRTVTPAGPDHVLVVLGEPGAGGGYEFLAQGVGVDEVGHELRTRLVCLERETGKLVWLTGAATETDALLGDRGTCCTSPPLVVGDDVYAIFANRRGTAAFHVACLDVRTGRPRWIAPLARGESGRAADAGEKDRFIGDHLQALPWGARPTLAEGELCVTPHAGFAAGLDVRTGRVRWLRALPRYVRDANHQAGDGHSPRNAPLAHGDAWLLAPLDSPRVTCLARGSGLLRWSRGLWEPRMHPPWRDLHGVGQDPAGVASVHVDGERPLRFDARTGLSLFTGVAPESLSSPPPPGARGFVEDGVLWRARAGRIEGIILDAADPQATRVGQELPAGAPRDGDLYRAGGHWIVVGEHELAVVQGEDVDRDLAPPATPPSAHVRACAAVAALQSARASGDPARIGPALERLTTVPGPDAQGAAARRVAAELLRWLEELPVNKAGTILARRQARTAMRHFEGALRALPTDLQGRLSWALVQRHIALGAGRRAVEELDRWIREAGTHPVRVPPQPHLEQQGQMQGALLAAQLLRHALDGVPGAGPALQERESAAMARLAAVLKEDEAALREAIRLAPGTEAAALGRRRLAERLIDAGRFADAADVLADMRLDPPHHEQGTGRQRLLAVGRLQLREARLRERAFDLDTARSLLEDLQHWAPQGLRGEQGRTLEQRVQVLRGATTSPGPNSQSFELDLWPEGRPKHPEQLGGLQIAGRRGPGAGLHPDHLLVIPGLTPEVWSIEAAQRLAVLPGDDEGWFGGTLAEADGWIPGGGVIVGSVVAKEPADRSQIRVDDWIRSWDGRPTPDLAHLIRAVAGATPGTLTDVGILRRGKSLMDQFRPGRRPLAQARNLLSYEYLYCDARGRVLVPGRAGLSWLDLAAKTRMPCWRWDEPGLIETMEVFGDQVYVAVRRRHRPDVVLRVDPQEGHTLWRQELAGDVLRMRVSGSALCVDVAGPARAFHLDRHGGDLRSSLRVVSPRSHEYRRTSTQAFTAACAPAGRGFAVLGDRVAPRLVCVNTTTAFTEWEHSWIAMTSVGGGPSGRLDPWISADAYVAALVRSDSLVMIPPDPLGARPAPGLFLVAGRDHLRTDSNHGGLLGHDTRLHVRGRDLYVVRNNRWRFVTTWVLRTHPERVRRLREGRGRVGDPVLHVLNERMLRDVPNGISRRPYLLHIQPRFDGVFVTGTCYGNPQSYVEMRWASDRSRGRKLLFGNQRAARRGVPVETNGHFVLPTDGGAWLIPAERLGGD